MSKRLAAVVLACGVLLGVYLLSHRGEPGRESRTPSRSTGSAEVSRGPPEPATNATVASAPRAIEPAPVSRLPVPPAPAPVEALPAELAGLPAATVLENMRTVFRLYSSTFGGNPVGTNPEITRALQGDNPKQINFLKADGNRVNAAGELVDIWGTPYFFHQLSGTEMEIRSAGPDRVMYTADDVVTE